MAEILTKDVRCRAQNALADSPIHALRELHVEENEQGLYLSGRVASFYHKQLAQELVLSVANGVRLTNGVHVS